MFFFIFFAILEKMDAKNPWRLQKRLKLLASFDVDDVVVVVVYCTLHDSLVGSKKGSR